MKLKTVAQNLKARFNEEFCQGNRKRRKRNLVFSPLDSVLSDASCIYLLLYFKHGPLRKQRNNFEICSFTLKISIPPCFLFPLKFEKNKKKI